MNVERIGIIAENMRLRSTRPGAGNMPINVEEYESTRENLMWVAKDVENDFPELSKKLKGLKDTVFFQQVTYPATIYFYVNPFAYGQAVGILDSIISEAKDPTRDMWSHVHPKIKRASEKLFKDGSYANATCDAFIEINVRVKSLFSKLRPDATKIPDGDTVMKTVFSANSPMVKFCDISSETGSNIQKGFMEMLSGAMSALRNPKSHENILISRENAMRQIIFASMLMYKIDEAVAYSGIQE